MHVGLDRVECVGAEKLGDLIVQNSKQLGDIEVSGGRGTKASFQPGSAFLSPEGLVVAGFWRIEAAKAGGATVTCDLISPQPTALAELHEGEVVLDILHRLQATQTPDLAVRWNCKAGKCGSCSAEINGRPRLLCMTRLNDFARFAGQKADVRMRTPDATGRRRFVGVEEIGFGLLVG